MRDRSLPQPLETITSDYFFAPRQALAEQQIPCGGLSCHLASIRGTDTGRRKTRWASFFEAVPSPKVQRCRGVDRSKPPESCHFGGSPNAGTDADTSEKGHAIFSGDCAHAPSGRQSRTWVLNWTAIWNWRRCQFFFLGRSSDFILKCAIQWSFPVSQKKVTWRRKLVTGVTLNAHFQTEGGKGCVSCANFGSRSICVCKYSA